MRYLLGIPLFLIPAIASAQASTLAQDDGSSRVIATATRTARLAPDRVSVYVVVEGSAESAAEAAQRADRKLQAVTDAVRQLGGRADIVGTVPFGVSPAPNFGGYPGQTASNALVARHILRVNVSRVDQLMNVSAALIAAGASAVTPPTFEASAADSARRAKSAEALAQARADAEALASGLGMRLGSLVTVTSNPGPSLGANQQFMNFGRGFEMAMTGAGAMPDVTVTATVTVTYRLQPR